MKFSINEILQLHANRNMPFVSSDTVRKHVDYLQRAIWSHTTSRSLTTYIDAYNGSRIGQFAEFKLTSAGDYGVVFESGNDTLTLEAKRI